MSARDTRSGRSELDRPDPFVCLPLIGVHLGCLLVLVTGVGLVFYAILAIPKQQEVAKRVHALLSRELEAAR